MKILLLGATGRTGKLVVEEAINRGIGLNCIGRDIGRIKANGKIKLFDSDPSSKKELSNAIKGCDYVINVLNISRTSDFPWSKLKTPKDYISRVIRNLIEISNEHDLKHIVSCSAWGVANSEKFIPRWFNFLIKNSNIRYAYQDHFKQEELLMKSNLHWTIVRPVGLSNAKEDEIILESFGNIPKPNLLISRKSVAKYLINCVASNSLKNKKVVISKK